MKKLVEMLDSKKGTERGDNTTPSSLHGFPKGEAVAISSLCFLKLRDCFACARNDEGAGLLRRFAPRNDGGVVLLRPFAPRNDEGRVTSLALATRREAVLIHKDSKIP